MPAGFTTESNRARASCVSSAPTFCWSSRSTVAAPSARAALGMYVGGRTNNPTRCESNVRAMRHASSRLRALLLLPSTGTRRVLYIRVSFAVR
jgi:hypothetical protein